MTTVRGRSIPHLAFLRLLASCFDSLSHIWRQPVHYHNKTKQMPTSEGRNFGLSSHRIDVVSRAQPNKQLHSEHVTTSTWQTRPTRATAVQMCKHSYARSEAQIAQTQGKELQRCDLCCGNDNCYLNCYNDNQRIGQCFQKRTPGAIR